MLIPLLFMRDVVGRLFREFAITLAVTILISAVVSLTLVPMMCAKILRHQRPARDVAVARKSQEWFDRLIADYGRLLNWVLDHQPLTLLVALATLALTVFLYVVIPKGFFPVQDTGLIQGISEASPSVSFAAMAERQQALAAAILQDPDVDSLSSFIGVDGTNTTLNSGRFLINLKPRDQRTSVGERHHPPARSARSPSVSGITLYMQPVQDLTIDATVSRTQYQFVLEDANAAEFATWVPKLLQRLDQIPQIDGCRQHLFRQRPVGLCQHRPRHRRALRHHAGDHRQCALRLVRPAHRLDDLHPVQPVPGDPRSRPDAAAVAELAGLDLSAVLDRGQRPGAAVGDRPDRGADGAARGRASRPVPGDDHVVQPGAGRLARRRRSTRSSRPRTRSACRSA